MYNQLMQKPKIIVILGTTATGKSDLAVKIAKKIGGEVISADSRQVYKGLDIGSGKITRKEMKGVKHYMLDIVNPKIKYTVAEYQKEAISTIAEIIKSGKTPIICGGTGFYIDAITKGIVFPLVPPNLKLRKALEKESAEKLFKILEKLDKIRAKDIKNKNEINNKVRLIRAIEIAKSLGKTPKIKEIKLPYKFIKIGLFLPKEKLETKIQKRVQKMFKDGLLKEIKKLKKDGISDKRLKEFGFEYNNPNVENVVRESIKYAKRQITWFKRPARPHESSGAGGDKQIKWFDASIKNLDKKVLKEIQN